MELPDLATKNTKTVAIDYVFAFYTVIHTLYLQSHSVVTITLQV